MGILLVYDVTDEASFNNIRNWMRNIEQHASDTVNKVRYCIWSMRLMCQSNAVKCSMHEHLKDLERLSRGTEDEALL